MMIAVVTKHGRLAFDRKDVFVAVAGGLTVTEPAADLAVCLALASTAVGMPIPPSTVAFGEVGLAGEVRRVPAIDRRLEEAARLGFTRAIVGRHVERAPAGMDLIRVDDVKGAVEALRSTPHAVASRGRGAA
jgi:DNA repair protein RadA/Sms